MRYWSLFSAIVLAASQLAGCSANNQSANAASTAQNDAHLQARLQEIQIVEGTYSGTIQVIGDRSYDCTLNVFHILETVNSSQPDNVGQTVQVAKLTGSLSVPVLENVNENDKQQFAALFWATGQQRRLLFDFGDFKRKTGALVLPYTAENNQNFGELNATFDGVRLTGFWVLKNPAGNFATISLTRISQ